MLPIHIVSVSTINPGISMSPDILSVMAATGTIIVTAGALALIYVTVRSKLPAATVKIQNESIAALEKQNDLLKVNIQELNLLVTKLQARVDILETLPLTNLAGNMERMTAILQDLSDLGKANAEFMRSGKMTVQASPAATNITVNK